MFFAFILHFLYSKFGTNDKIAYLCTYIITNDIINNFKRILLWLT